MSYYCTARLSPCAWIPTSEPQRRREWYEHQEPRPGPTWTFIARGTPSSSAWKTLRPPPPTPAKTRRCQDSSRRFCPRGLPRESSGIPMLWLVRRRLSRAKPTAVAGADLPHMTDGMRIDPNCRPQASALRHGWTKACLRAAALHGRDPQMEFAAPQHSLRPPG